MLVRGATVGVLAALVAAAAHAVGGGAPSESSIVLLAVVCAVVGIGVHSDGRAGAARLLLSLAGAQAVGHGVLSIAGGHHHGTVHVATHVTPAHMLAAHTLAVALGAVLIATADRAVAHAISTAQRVVPRFVPARAVPVRPVLCDPRPTRSRVLELSGRGTRGPPIAA